SIMPTQSSNRIEEDKLLAEWAEVQAAQTDPSRFKPLYDRYYERIFRYLLRRCEDETTAADLSSQVFLKALRRIGQYQYRGLPFSAWLFRIAANELKLFYRQNKRRRVVSADLSIYSEFAEETEDITAQERSEREAELRRVLRNLKPEELNLVEMRFFEQRPFAEIAAILDVTEATAKMRTYRLLNRLKTQLSTLNRP
ncbi:MAG: sigma-70 family RNA polymerase sigma factor, partial [Bacteroidota bacterium]